MKDNNSKVIKLCRIVPFSQEANQELDEFFGQAVRGIGSYLPKGSRKAGTGLTLEEEKLLMPGLLNMAPDDRDFRKDLDLFFTEITTKVPHEGLPLEIGLIDNNRSLGATLDSGRINMPLDLEAYVKYRHAKSHPHTALSKEEAIGNQIKMFYVLDEKKTALAKKEENDIKDAAQLGYLNIKGNAEKVEMILTILSPKGIDVRDMDHDKAVLALKGYINNDDVSYSKDFITVLEDKKLETKFRIKKLIQTNILKYVGNVILITESGTKIGNDLEQSVLWFEDASNSEVVGTLRARYQEFKKKKKEVIKEIVKEEETEE